MPPTVAFATRDLRILAGHAAGATILDQLAIAEEIDPAVVRRILRAAGITPGPLRKLGVDRATHCLADPAWQRAEYATKGAKRIAQELGCSHDRVYEALHAVGIPMRENGHPQVLKEIPPETAERIVSLYLAGWTAERVAAELGLQVKKVNSLLEERGVKRSRSDVASLANARRRKPAVEKPPREWPPELQDEMLQRYAVGESGEVIAEAMGLVASSVYRVLRKHGVVRRQRQARLIRDEGRPRPAFVRQAPEVMQADLAEDAVGRYLDGESPRLIAVALGVPASRVYRLLKERGVMRSRSEARKVDWARRRAVAGQELPTVGAPAGKRDKQWAPELQAQFLQRYAAGDRGGAWR